MLACGDGVFRAVAEDESFAAGDFCGTQQMRNVSIERDLSQANHDTQVRQQRDFFLHKRGAVADFRRQRFISRRGAAHHGADAKTVQTHAIQSRLRRRLRRKPGQKQHRIEEISRSIAGKRTSGSVGAMRAGRKTQRQYACVGIAERGNWFPPIDLVGIRATSHTRDFRAIGSQPRTKLTSSNASGELFKRGGRRRQGESSMVQRRCWVVPLLYGGARTGHIENCTIRISLDGVQFSVSHASLMLDAARRSRRGSAFHSWKCKIPSCRRILRRKWVL